MSYRYAGRYADSIHSATTGRPLVGTPVTVYDADGVTVSTLYTDRTKATPASNPVNVDANGNLGFHATPGRYFLSYNGVTLAVTVNPDTGDLAHELAHGKASGGTQTWGIPGATLGVDGTLAITAGRDYYLGVPLLVEHPINVTDLGLEITTGPAGASNLRVGLYAADVDLQASGAPLYDSADIAVANGFTGTKTKTGLTVALGVGLYLPVINLQANMTLRTWQTAAPVSFGVSTALGTAAQVHGGYKARAYAAFPTPGALWDTEVKANTLPVAVLLAKWTEL